MPTFGAFWSTRTEPRPEHFFEFDGSARRSARYRKSTELVPAMASQCACMPGTCRRTPTGTPTDLKTDLWSHRGPRIGWFRRGTEGGQREVPRFVLLTAVKRPRTDAGEGQHTPQHLSATLITITNLSMNSNGMGLTNIYKVHVG